MKTVRVSRIYEYPDDTEDQEAIDDAKIINSFLNNLSLKEQNRLMKKFKKFQK